MNTHASREVMAPYFPFCTCWFVQAIGAQAALRSAHRKWLRSCCLYTHAFVHLFSTQPLRWEACSRFQLQSSGFFWTKLVEKVNCQIVRVCVISTFRTYSQLIIASSWQVSNSKVTQKMRTIAMKKHSPNIKLLCSRTIFEFLYWTIKC